MEYGFVILHDLRLAGVIPPKRPHLKLVEVSGHTSLHRAFGRIKAVRHIHSLFIVCHGFAGENKRAKVCVDAGGMGLELGKELVLHSNVAMWRSLANSAENIVVYACAAGDTEPGNEGTTADGKYLMGALAIHTNTPVFAADRIQWYQPNNGGHIDFGDWEGTLWQFPPSGQAPTPVLRAPFELNDVLS